MSDPRASLLFALADDELILGHRLSEWTGWVPYIEEDLALSSIAQDEIAHARMLLDILSVIDGRDPDALALGRAPGEYRNAILCEQPNTDFAFTLARHWLYDHADDVRLRALQESSFKELREAVAVMLLEERYHLEHADAWFRRLADGPVDARHRFGEALANAIGMAEALFEPLDDESVLVSEGILPTGTEEWHDEWLARIGGMLDEVGFDQVLTSQGEPETGEMVPTSTGEIESTEQIARRVPSSGAGGRRGEHSEHFEPLWLEMTTLYRAHPGARW
ncbi:MAG: phenylacetate-CoA oxygenase subunit PaaC [Actinobacteria bacterium]|nr:MAG: phenylacetate-CoA oxygenase subunit PaaC [Actinomycetota bacterium]